MSDDGTTFTIDLPVTGQAQIDAAASSMETLAAQISAGEAAYRRAQTSADAISKALERVGVAAELERVKLQAAMDIGDASGAEKAAASLQTLVARQSVLETKAEAAKAALLEQAEALDKLNEGSVKAAEGEKKLQDQEDKGAEEGGGGEFRFESLERGLNKLGGPLGTIGAKVAGVGSGFGKLTKSLGDAAPYAVAALGIAAVAAAVVALAAKVIESIAAITEWAVKLADANRSALLLSDGIARSVQGGAILNDKINALTKTLPLTQQELQSMASNLANSGLRGQALANALDQAAVKAARLKFGPDFAKQMLSLDEQSKVFNANLADIFGSLKTDALMEGLQKLIALFDANTASGKALKTLFTSIFQPIVDWIASLVPKVERFFLQLEIWAMKAMIAIKPYGSTIKFIGEVLLVIAAIIVGVLVAAFVVLAAVIAAPFALLAALALAVRWVVQEFIKGWNAISGFFKNLNIADMGKSLIDGLINGIKSGATAVINAMKGVVTGAIDAAKKALGIASPSKVFAEIGVQTGAGMEQGVNKGSAGVQSSLETMVAPPPGKPGSATAQTSAPSSSGGKGSNFSGAQFHFYGVKDAADAEQRFHEMLVRAIEGDVAQLGGAAPAT